MRTWDDFKKTMRAEDPIFDFARQGNLEGLKLSANQNNIHDKDANGYSALMLAAYYGHLEASEFLLGLGADPNSTDKSHNSILMGVSFKGYLPVVKLLMAHGADPKFTNDKNQTALQFAQMFGRSEVANYLNSTKEFKMTDQIASWLTYVFPKRSLK